MKKRELESLVQPFIGNSQLAIKMLDDYVAGLEREDTDIDYKKVVVALIVGNAEEKNTDAIINDEEAVKKYIHAYSEIIKSAYQAYDEQSFIEDVANSTKGEHGHIHRVLNKLFLLLSDREILDEELVEIILEGNKDQLEVITALLAYDDPEDPSRDAEPDTLDRDIVVRLMHVPKEEQFKNSIFCALEQLVITKENFNEYMDEHVDSSRPSLGM